MEGEIMIITPTKRAIGNVISYEVATEVIQALNQEGGSLCQISLIGQNIDRQQDQPIELPGSYSSGVISGLTTLEGDSLFVTGALANTLANQLTGASATGLVQALTRLGIPEESAQLHYDRLGNSNYIILIEGTDDQLNQAEVLIDSTAIQNWEIYPATATVMHKTQ
jgi:hypothetical protein